MRLTQKDINRLVKHAEELLTRQHSILSSKQTERRVSQWELPQRNGERTQRPTNEPNVAKRALKWWCTWLTKVVANVATEIRGFYNSTTSTRPKNAGLSAECSPTVVIGVMRSFGEKFASAESSALTAMQSTPSPNRTITPMKRCRLYLPEFTSDTELRSEEIASRIVLGESLEDISLIEYLQMAFLCIIDGEELHMNTTIKYGGAVYDLHACLREVIAPVAASQLRKSQ